MSALSMIEVEKELWSKPEKTEVTERKNRTPTIHNTFQVEGWVVSTR